MENQIIENLITTINLFKKGEIKCLNIFKTQNLPDYENEFLFFIKPELLLPDSDTNLRLILETTFAQLHKFNFTVCEINILSSAYIDENDIIANHYGIINRLSKAPKKHLSEKAINTFQSLYDIRASDAKIWGSLELLEKEVLDVSYFNNVIKNCKAEKLDSGCYCYKTEYKNEPIFIINVFHPQQLMHFTANNRSVITFQLRSNTDWGVARNKFLGVTNPIMAIDGSLRKTMLDKKDIFKITEINNSLNCFHLSAGPVEALIELMRFNFHNTKISDYNFGKKLPEKFTEQQITNILSNPAIEYNHKLLSVFDMTEEKNTNEALEILKEIF